MVIGEERNRVETDRSRNTVPRGVKGNEKEIH